MDERQTVIDCRAAADTLDLLANGDAHSHSALVMLDDYKRQAAAVRRAADVVAQLCIMNLPIDTDLISDD